MTSIAIIGAGLSGLSLANKLINEFDVDVYEKSARPGGRIASRSNTLTEFDHGAQFFTVKSTAFSEFLSPMIKAGVIADWHARFVELDQDQVISWRQWSSEFPHYVGYPSMSAIGEWLSRDLNIHYGQRIKCLFQERGKWLLQTENGTLSRPYDWVILTSPAEQTSELIPDETAFKETLSQIKMLPCYAMMVTLREAPDLDFEAALVKNTNISWISVNHSKPGRHGLGLVAHASNAWAADNLDAPLDYIRDSMLERLIRLTGINPDLVKHTDVKRWVFANIPKQTGQPYLIDNNNKLAACGDWCIAGRVEAAFTSASLLAKHFVGLDTLPD